MKVKLRELPPPETLPFKEAMDKDAKEGIDDQRAHPDSDDEDEYTPSVAGRAGEDEEESPNR